MIGEEGDTAQADDGYEADDCGVDFGTVSGVCEVVCYPLYSVMYPPFFSMSWTEMRVVTMFTARIGGIHIRSWFFLPVSVFEGGGD